MIYQINSFDDIQVDDSYDGEDDYHVDDYDSDDYSNDSVDENDDVGEW